MRGPKLLRRLAPLLVAAALLGGCEQVMGVDFTTYKTGPTGCSPFVDNACSSGLACLYDTTAQSFACRASIGTQGGEGRCDLESDCEPGLACVSFDGTNFGHCVGYCQTSGVCGNGRTCHEFTTPRKIFDGNTAGACGLREPPCNPLASPAGCDAGERCALIDNDYAVCVNQGQNLAVGKACDYINDCVETAICVGNGSGGTCRSYCDMTAPACPGGQTCNSFSPTVTWQGAEFGFCK